MATLIVNARPPSDALTGDVLILRVYAPGESSDPAAAATPLVETVEPVGTGPATAPREIQATVDVLAFGGCDVFEWSLTCRDEAGNEDAYFRSFDRLSDPPEPVEALRVEPAGPGLAAASWSL